MNRRRCQKFLMHDLNHFSKLVENNGYSATSGCKGSLEKSFKLQLSNFTMQISKLQWISTHRYRTGRLADCPNGFLRMNSEGSLSEISGSLRLVHISLVFLETQKVGITGISVELPM